MRFECAAYGIGHNTGLNCPVKSLDIACAIVRIRKVNVAFRKRLAGYAVHTHNDHLPCHNAVGFQFPVLYYFSNIFARLTLISVSLDFA